MKFTFIFIFGFLFVSASFAQSTCISEGDYVGVYPNAPQCCKGLEIQAPPEGTYGSAGKCIKKSKCVEEGGYVALFPNSPSCCTGLKLKPSPKGTYGSAGQCIQDSSKESLEVYDEDIDLKEAGMGPTLSPKTKKSQGKIE